MKNWFESRSYRVAAVALSLAVATTAWSANDSAALATGEFDSEEHFDFSSQEQLLELPAHSEDPSFLDNGKLICPIAAGTHKGLGKQFLLEREGSFTDEVEFSFDIYLDENFQIGTHPNEIGKFPGMEGIYDLSAGWGGKPVNQENSWSIRIGHLQQNKDGEVPIGLYIYHPDMPGQYGTGVPTDFALQTMKTYRLTLYVKLNDVGMDNGVIKLFADGVPIYSSDSWRLRLSDAVHVKSVWLDTYIGGVTPTPVDTWVALDNLHIRWKKCTDSDCSVDGGISPPLPPGNIEAVRRLK